MADYGDPIGGTDGGIDYSTGCTFVYKQTVKNKTVVTLVDRQGNVVIPQDASSADYKQNTQWMDQQKAGVMPAQPPTGFTGYPGGYPGGPGGPPGMPPIARPPQ